MSLWVRMVSIILPMGILLGGAMGVFWSLQPHRFPLRVIEIRDQLKWTSSQAITQVASPYMDRGFFGLDVEALQKALNNLPWMSSVSVRRVWPDRIILSTEEKTPLARFGEEGVLSTEGRIFYPDLQSLPDRLPQFMGPSDRAKEMVQQYFSILEMLSPLGLSVSELNLSPEGSWRMVLDNGIAIILGKAALNERMGRFVWIYPNQLQMQIHKIAYLDLRYTNGVAIGWKAFVQ
jgi:cell division protein FtsQ